MTQPPSNSHDTAIAEELDHRIARATGPYRNCVVPLYSHRIGRPEIIGTGVAVAAEGARLLFSASHVFRDFADDTIFVAHGGGWSPLTGTAHHANTPGVIDPHDDRLDAAILELDEKSRDKWSTWISPNSLRPGAPATANDRFITIGFPRSKLKYDFDAAEVTPRAITYLGAPSRAEIKSLAPYHPETHIVVGFNQKRVQQGTETLTAPSMRGVSGGLTLHVPRLATPDAADEARVAGIFIEWPSPDRFLISTRIDVHLLLLQQKLPHLAHLFPKPVSVHGRGIESPVISREDG